MSEKETSLTNLENTLIKNSLILETCQNRIHISDILAGITFFSGQLLIWTEIYVKLMKGRPRHANKAKFID